MAWYAENSTWPYVHTQTSSALYIATRRPFFSWLVGYVAESVEAALRDDIAEFSENIKDSLLADPITNGLAILAFWLVDQLYHSDVAFDELVPWWQRLAIFMLVFTTAPIAWAIGGTVFYVGIMITYAIVTLVTLVGYSNIIFLAPRDSRLHLAGRSVVVWIVLMLPYAIVSLPVTTEDNSPFVSSWFRVTYVSVAYVALFGGANIFAYIKKWV